MSRDTLALILSLWLLLLLGQWLGMPRLAYDRELVGQGDWWRLVSAHVVHLNTVHLALNMLGVGLVLALYDRVLPVWHWLVVLLAGALAVGGLIHVASPAVERYAGLSGVIHTLYVAGALALWRRPGERVLAAVLLVLVTLKLLTESLGQGISLTAELIGGPVLFAAHAYGALAGLALALLAAMANFFHRKRL